MENINNRIQFLKQAVQLFNKDVKHNSHRTNQNANCSTKRHQSMKAGKKGNIFLSYKEYKKGRTSRD